MTDDEQRFMVFEGLVQWTTGVISQAEQIALATSALNAANINIRLPAAKLRTQHHYFSLAAFKLLEHRNRAIELGLCSNTNFQMLDSFSFCDIRDLRNMREHVLDYFKGEGRDKERRKIETPEYHADASAAAGQPRLAQPDRSPARPECERPPSGGLFLASLFGCRI
jgi:hypothetical protein